MPIDPDRFRLPPRYDAVQLTQKAGLDLDLARRVFRALGFPEVPDDQVEFDDRDLEVGRALRLLLDQGYSETDVLTVARTYGYSLSRLAFAEVRLFSKTTIDPLLAEGVAGQELLDRLDQVVPPMLELLDTQLQALHRRHLAIALRQVTESQREGNTEKAAGGFADLVGFSRLSNDLEGDDLEDLITRFETLVVERCVDAGAQVVKVLGDAVMFVASAPQAALEAALRVVEGVGEIPELPQARAGLDYGDVRTVGGDYFGRPINVAARLTGFARPGTVVISEELLSALPSPPDVSRIRLARLKGVGTVRAFKVNEALGSAVTTQHDGDYTDEEGSEMASKDKGGKAEKKAPKKSLKEKRASKKDKKGGGGRGV
jgi:adenylate cyclase